MTNPNPVAGTLGPASLPRTVFEATVDEHHPDLLKRARWRANGDPHLAEDVLQQVYEKVLRRIARDLAVPDNPVALSHYMRRAIDNATTDHYRTYGNRMIPQGLDIPSSREASDDDTPEDVVLAQAYRQVAARVNSLLDKLPERQREVVKLMFWKQMDKAQVAAHLGIKVTSVDKYLRLAKKNLKAGAQEIVKEVVA
ncbi:sigma-70 family RNA polymerase sigma factor [Streptomyces olivoreticuli]|uniref:RNA polymerase sigma factor n=1 Tax=Streptomyces olivoreticuli TaxID=68246 RepID=UPI0013C30367|nr:sigma-70 family RNA polymerase sigma factor [Streptomyces olivoreticuli]